MATIFPREEKAEYLFDKILENSQACERLMETFYESVESDSEYSGEVLPPEKIYQLLTLIRIKNRPFPSGNLSAQHVRSS